MFKLLHPKRVWSIKTVVTPIPFRVSVVKVLLSLIIVRQQFLFTRQIAPPNIIRRYGQIPPFMASLRRKILAFNGGLFF